MIPILKIAKSVFHEMRNRAVLDYKRCILDCLEPLSVCVSLLDCGCDDGEWMLELSDKKTGSFFH